MQIAGCPSYDPFCIMGGGGADPSPCGDRFSPECSGDELFELNVGPRKTGSGYRESSSGGGSGAGGAGGSGPRFATSSSTRSTTAPGPTSPGIVLVLMLLILVAVSR